MQRSCTEHHIWWYKHMGRPIQVKKVRITAVVLIPHCIFRSVFSKKKCMYERAGFCYCLGDMCHLMMYVLQGVEGMSLFDLESASLVVLLKEKLLHFKRTAYSAIKMSSLKSAPSRFFPIPRKTRGRSNWGNNSEWYGQIRKEEKDPIKFLPSPLCTCV